MKTQSLYRELDDYCSRLGQFATMCLQPSVRRIPLLEPETALQETYLALALDLFAIRHRHVNVCSGLSGRCTLLAQELWELGLPRMPRVEDPWPLKALVYQETQTELRQLLEAYA